jgi:hypothetical protein
MIGAEMSAEEPGLSRDRLSSTKIRPRPGLVEA